MTSFLTSISGKFSQALIQGVFAPAAIFVIIGLVVLGPLFPGEVTVFQPLASLETGWQLLAITLIVVVLSLLLYGLNIPLIRLYEGYPWKDNALGQLRVRRYQEQVAALDSRSSALGALLAEMDDIDEKIHLPVPDPDALRQRAAALQGWSRLDRIRRATPGLDWDTPDQEVEKWQVLRALVNSEYARMMRKRRLGFPSDPGLVMPTRLGNIIRNFESYSYEQYHMDPIILWPRLTGVIPSGYQTLVDDAKTGFDFMLNCSFLSALLAGFVGLTGLVYPLPAASPGQLFAWLGLILGLLLLSYWFYLQTFSAAENWGDRVRSAFDLFKKDLKEELGYQQALRERSAEQALWHEISSQMFYGYTNREGGIALPYNDPPTPPFSLLVEPPDVSTQVARGIKRRWSCGSIEFFIQVVNASPAGSTVPLVIKRLVIKDTLPAGWLLEDHTAASDHGILYLSADPNPIFTIEELGLAPGAVLLVTYRALPLEAKT